MKKILFFLFALPLMANAQQYSYGMSELDLTELVSGTLYMPDTKEKCAMVILHAGSGPTDRNGNQPGSEPNNSLRFLAEELAAKGIAVYAYDKRMFKLGLKKDFDQRDMSFDDQIDDAAMAVNHFKKDTRFNKVIPAGHSEGSLVCMIAAGKSNADAYISIAGAGNTIDVVLEEQIGKQASFLVEDLKKTFVHLKKGDTVTVTNPYLMGLFNPSVQPFLISWVKYNPQDEIKKLNMPVLILNGTKDLQVGVKEAELLKAAKPDAELVIIENMNHVLKEIKTDDAENQASYKNPKLPVQKELVDAIVAFVNKLK